MARTYNGSSAWIDLGFTVSALSPLTVACWLKRSASATGDYVKAAVAQDADTGGRSFVLGIAGDLNVGPVLNALYVEWAGATGALWVYGGTALTQGQWYHGVYVYNGSTHTLYQNGVSVGTPQTLAGPPAATTHLTIGRRNYTGFEAYFPGNIAEVGIWSAALALGEIQMLAAGVSPASVHASALGGYWAGYTAGSPEPDWSSNGHNGTVTGTTVADHPPVRPLTGGELWAPYWVAQPAAPPATAGTMQGRRQLWQLVRG